MRPLRVISMGVLIPFFMGCGVIYADVGFTCVDPDLDHVGKDGTPDPCHHEDGCMTGSICEPVADGWEGPWLLWRGPLGIDPPPCPHGTPIGHEGYADFNPSNAGCPACTCGPSHGSCGLPSGFTASSAPCGMPGVTTSFDAPSPWSGACDGKAPVPAGVAVSVTIDPVPINELGCAPGPSAPLRESNSIWNSYTRTCHGDGWSLCNDGKSFCVPEADHTIPRFRLCISQQGDLPCMGDALPPFTERIVVYDGVEDTRNCSPCTCGPPQGSECTATLTLDQDAMCTEPVEQGIHLKSDGETCVNLSESLPLLGGKVSTPGVYHPGSCEPMGGSPTGSLTPHGAMTYCCIP